MRGVYGESEQELAWKGVNSVWWLCAVL